ncbi:MAG: hypothetical protein ABR903_09755 [Thermodesulfovibrionales bacterium]|jgi:hypothetical protein
MVIFFQRFQYIAAIIMGIAPLCVFLAPLPASPSELPEIVTSISFDMENKVLKG